MLVRIQWILIALLALSTVAVALIGRQSAAEARMQAERALMEAQDRMSMMAALTSREPVEEIIVGVGDDLRVQCDAAPQLNQSCTVQRDGHALFREIGWVDVAGKSRPQVETILTSRFGDAVEGVGNVYVIVDSAR